MTRLSVLTGLPDGARLALGAAAEHPDGWFPPDTAPATLGWLRRNRYGRPYKQTYKQDGVTVAPSGNWTITPAGRNAFARADLALKNAPQTIAYPTTTGVSTMNLDQGWLPQRSLCRFCKAIIEKMQPGDEWSSAKGPGLSGRDTECAKAPNPDDGPMPGHQPGRIVTPESEPAPTGPPPAGAVIPYIPRHPGHQPGRIATPEPEPGQTIMMIPAFDVLAGEYKEEALILTRYDEQDEDDG